MDTLEKIKVAAVAIPIIFFTTIALGALGCASLLIGWNGMELVRANVPPYTSEAVFNYSILCAAVAVLAGGISACLFFILDNKVWKSKK